MTLLSALSLLAVTARGATCAKPSAAQLTYQRHELVALIHFNMATYAKDGDPGCDAHNWAKLAPGAAGMTKDPKTFNPAHLDTDNWAASMRALGAKHAVLTAKHGCGFLLWPTKTKLPSGAPYGYDVGHGVGKDVLRAFSRSMSDAGIGHGFYYSLTNNFYLDVRSHYVQNSTLLPGQQAVSQSQFEALALQQVTELWSDYGNLTELWFDGGYTSDMKEQIKGLLAAKQPDATAFNGEGISPNPICWVGTESGDPASRDVWSLGGGAGCGDPSSSTFCPRGCDTTLQEGDAWFYGEGKPIRTLKELISVYHSSVGRNCVMELDFAINRDGVVEPSHAAAYGALGDWIRACYGRAAAEASAPRDGGAVLELRLDRGGAIDRVMLAEELTQGQLVRNYTVEIRNGSNGEVIPFSSGHSIGNKRIDVLDEAVQLAPGSLMRLTVSPPAAARYMSRFAAFKPCEVPAAAAADRQSYYV